MKVFWWLAASVLVHLPTDVSGTGNRLLRKGTTQTPEDLKKELMKAQEATIEKLKQAETPEDLLEAGVNGIEDSSTNLQNAIDLINEAAGSELASENEGFANMVADVKEIAKSADVNFQELLVIMKDDINARLLNEGDSNLVENETKVATVVPAADGWTGGSTTSKNKRKKRSSGNNNGKTKGSTSWNAKFSQAKFRERAGPKHTHLFDLHEAMAGGNHEHLERTFTEMHQHYQSRYEGEGRRRMQKTSQKGSEYEPLTVKQKKCLQLRTCALGMSTYDTMVYFHSDDLDTTEGGTFDRFMSTYDEDDLVAKRETIRQLASGVSVRSPGSNTCDNLLMQFHRNVERGDIPFWEGGTVSQVCLAEGTTVAVKMDEIAANAGFSTAMAISHEFIQCTQALHDGRPSDAAYTNDPKPFINGQGTYGEVLYRFPTEFNTDEGRDEHGHVIDKTKLYKYETKDRTDIYLRNLQCYNTCAGLPIIPGMGERNCNTASTCDTLQEKVQEVVEAYEIDEEYSQKDIDDFVESNLEPIQEYFEGVQTGFEVLFGDNPSVGYVCGTENMIQNGGQIPGRCCLDAPYENPGDLWGSPYECSETCQNPGSYLSGLNEEACKAQGGTFCSNPVNCVVLRDCVQNEINSVDRDFKLSAYKNYLESSPRIADPLDSSQCGEAREYFGFQPTYINDGDICENVQQLRFTRNFQFLEEFFGQGSDGSGGDGSGGDGSGEISGGGLPELLPPDRTLSQSPVVQNGITWRATNFALGHLFTGLKSIYDTVADFACPNDLTGLVQTACAIGKNISTLIISVLFAVLQTVIAISSFTYSTLAELGNIEPAEIYENTQAIFDNMVASADWQLIRFTEISDRFSEVSDRFSEISNKVVPQPDKFSPRGASGKFAGCDGIDQNQNGEADECKEDDFEPSIFIPEGLALDLDCTDERQKCIDKVFPNKEAAILYLEHQLQVIDDCGHPDTLSLDIAHLDGECGTSRFRATPQHTCDQEISRGDSVEFVMPVDASAPEVVCGFRLNGSEPGMRMDGSHLVVTEKPSMKFTTIPFVFDVQDNCNGTVDVRVSVSSNEYADEEARLGRLSSANVPDQAIIWLAPGTCAGAKNGEPCDTSGAEDFRLYHITVKATDEAGNSKEATCHVIVEPEPAAETNVFLVPLDILEAAETANMRYDLGAVDLVWQ